MKHILQNAEPVLSQVSVLKMHNIGPKVQCYPNISWLLVEPTVFSSRSNKYKSNFILLLSF